MKNQLVNLTSEIELKPGEKLTLPPSLVESIGAGNWTSPSNQSKQKLQLLEATMPF